MTSSNRKEEPSTAPEPDRWYNITLGSSLKDVVSCSPRFCTLRYEFKPASIDNTQSGLLHKNKDNRVTVEFQNNQHGKPKVSFEGVNEDYKDKDRDAVLFFDGETFRLEKLHRAVNRLRYVRIPGGESAVASVSSTTLVNPVTESYSSPATKVTQAVPTVPETVQSVKMVQIDINNPLSLENEGEDVPSSSLAASLPTKSQNSNMDESEDVNIDGDDDDDDDDGGQRTAKGEITSTGECRTGSGGLDIDINLPHPSEMDEDEIADVDINDDEPNKGLNAAEELRAQVNAEAKEGHKSLSSSSGKESESSESGSESSDSGSESSSSESRSSGSESGTASDSVSHASV